MLIVSYKYEKEKQSIVKRYSKILNMSAWGIVIVISTIGMSVFGVWLDKIFNTQPMFMVGLCCLANWTTMYRMYLETKRK